MFATPTAREVAGHGAGIVVEDLDNVGHAFHDYSVAIRLMRGRWNRGKIAMGFPSGYRGRNRERQRDGEASRAWASGPRS